MYILFFSIPIIIGIVLIIIGIKKCNRTVDEIIEQRRTQIEESLQTQLLETKHQMEAVQNELSSIKSERDQVARERKVEIERLADIKRERDDIVKREVQHLQEQLDLNQKLKLQQLDSEYKERNDLLLKQYITIREHYEEELAICKSDLDQFRSVQASINEAILRKKELKDQLTFYSINVPQNDREDIALLQSMDMKLHHRDVIPKLIWELFIRRPTQEMIKRVVGDKKASGIYKITYNETDEAYIGKTTDFATRWQNHVKTVLGLEGAARATLHNRMAQDGLWNYTFEILERVDKDQLAAREAYYIDLYGTKTQLNMKSGDKNGTQ